MGTPSPSGLQVQVVDAGATLLLRVSGELDIATAPCLETVLAPLTGRACELDLAHVTFIDSTGINLLTRHHRHTTAVGGRLRLVAASQAVRRILDITGTAYLLTGDLGPPSPDHAGSP
ncbi:STAS domain-containing protein [Streptomyces sp. E5N91]|uniref:STAS domain-containing protein n=1 Tax=Streptomyces sp. E5N91 TaxID=1851996 RepID=UPI00187D4D2C|nr:STAS domain-containing protein [Streptomyces sp. E5N91]